MIQGTPSLALVSTCLGATMQSTPNQLQPHTHIGEEQEAQMLIGPCNAYQQYQQCTMHFANAETA